MRNLLFGPGTWLSDGGGASLSHVVILILKERRDPLHGNPVHLLVKGVIRELFSFLTVSGLELRQPGHNALGCHILDPSLSCVTEA